LTGLKILHMHAYNWRYGA